MTYFPELDRHLHVPTELLNNTDEVLLNAAIDDLIGPTGDEDPMTRKELYWMSYAALEKLAAKGNPGAIDFLTRECGGVRYDAEKEERLGAALPAAPALPAAEEAREFFGKHMTYARQPTVTIEATIPADMKLKDLADAIRPLGLELSVDSRGAPTIVPSR